MKAFWIFLLFLGVGGMVSAQPPIQWQRPLGGFSVEEINIIKETNNNGFILAGLARSQNGDVSGVHGETDFWVVNLNHQGQILWQKALGGTSYDVAHAVANTAEGGYIVAGKTLSNDGDVTGNHGNYDFWIVKLSSLGQIEWQKTLGGSDEDVAQSILQTSDGGYVVAGWSYSNDGDAVGNTGFHYWVLKITSTGILEWQNSFGGTGGEMAHDIQEAMDGGFVLVGRTYSNNGDVSGSHGGSEFWVVKISNIGQLEWQKTLGGTGVDIGQSICKGADDGYMVVGFTSSLGTGQVTYNHGGLDVWAVKLNNSGEIQWQKTFGGSDNDWGNFVSTTSDGGYVIIGETISNDGDVSENDGGVDIWALKINNIGEIQWQKTLGGTDTEYGSAIEQTKDGGYILSGYTHSDNGDVVGFHGSRDGWIVKLSPESTPTTNIPAQTLEIYPNPTQSTLSLKIADTVSPNVVLNLRISDLLGRVFSQQNINSNQSVDISALPSGLYLLSAITPDGTEFVGRFCKQD